jgi:hypothetical protein
MEDKEFLYGCLALSVIFVLVVVSVTLLVCFFIIAVSWATRIGLGL